MGCMRPLAIAIGCNPGLHANSKWSGVLDKFSLSVYGVGYISVDLNDSGGTSDVTIASNSSRLGFHGGVELTRELSIIAQYENGVDLTACGRNDGNGGTNSDARLFTMVRDSFAGLYHKSFGELVAGRVGALNQYLYDYNLFADQIGDLGNLWGTHGLFDRIDVAVQYTSPSFLGFGVRGIIAPRSGEGDGDVYQFKGNYGKHGFIVGVAYLNQGQATVGVSEHQSFAATTSYTFDEGKYSVGAVINGNSTLAVLMETISTAYCINPEIYAIYDIQID